jgi:hypothetical protein
MYLKSEDCEDMKCVERKPILAYVLIKCCKYFLAPNLFVLLSTKSVGRVGYLLNRWEHKNSMSVCKKLILFAHSAFLITIDGHVC